MSTEGEVVSLVTGRKELCRRLNPLVADWREEGRKENPGEGAGRFDREVRLGSSFGLVALSVSCTGL